MKNIKKTTEFIYKYRYYIAIIVFILCVMLEISGSSIGVWKEFINAGEIKDGVLLGKSRGIRSDEWAVFTPMIFSQKFDGFKYFSNIIRGDVTDVFIVYGLPIINILQIFRPFQLGFLFLGIAKGLSFFWCGRFIALFLVSFELNMIICKKNKLISFVGAIMITLAPMIQWWFAVNGIVEIFVFGGLALILLKKYMNEQSFKNRCLYLLLMVICAVGYIIVLYPAWQIPMFYVFLAIAIWIIIDNRKQCKINKKDIFTIIGAVILFLICIIYIFSKSLDTIKIVMNTVYPGARNETGGTAKFSYFDYLMNVFMPFKAEGITTNTCEKATMFGLFPLGIIISCVVMYKEKKKDLLLILLLISYSFLSIWCIVGFPEIIAKITLMKNSQAQRCMLSVGYLDILLLIRSFSTIKIQINRHIAIIVSILLSIIMITICKINNRAYINIKMAIAMAIMCIYLFYFALRFNTKYANYLFSIGIMFVMIMGGATINPIRKGVDIIYKNDIIKEIEKVNQEKQGKWIAEGFDFPIPNYLLMAGASTINSTNTYPDLERWQMIDEKRKYEDIYNRYAHIKINLVQSEDNYDNKFILKQADVFEVNILPEELKKLEVEYIFTPNELEKFETEQIRFEKIYSNNNYNIFRIKK